MFDWTRTRSIIYRSGSGVHTLVHARGNLDPVPPHRHSWMVERIWGFPFATPSCVKASAGYHRIQCRDKPDPIVQKSPYHSSSHVVALGLNTTLGAERTDGSEPLVVQLFSSD